MMGRALRRRSFLTAAGAFTLGWTVPGGVLRAQGAATGPELGLWVVIQPDDAIVVRIARSEMGQGTLTDLAQLMAEELEADWSRVRAELVPPHVNFAHKHAWGDMLTGGSRGLRTSVAYVMQGGAAARTMLVQAAAERWGMPVMECRARLGVVTHAGSGRSLRYGELAEAASKLPVPKDVPLKAEADWTLIGKPLPRLDTAPKLDGSLLYGIDVRLPDMLSAALAQCPVFGGKLAGFDADAALQRPGVRQVVPVFDNAVAVVADTWWQAKTALEAMPIQWREGPNAGVDSKQIAERVAQGLEATDAGAGNMIGDAKAALASAATRVEGVYGAPFLNHATLEPMNCTALVADGGVEVWVGTQNGDATLAAAAEMAGVPLERVVVHNYTLGGGFGRRGQQDYVRYAVAVAAGAGPPGEAAVVARGRHAARLLPSGQPGEAHGRAGRARQPHGAPHADQRTEHQRLAAPRWQPARHRPAADAGRRTGGVRLHGDPEPAGRLRHAQHARAGRAVAGREPEPERVLPGMLHG